MTVGLFAPASAGALTGQGCVSGYCVWSGANYTGTKVELQIPGYGACFVPSASGFDAARSAVVNGTDTLFLALKFYANADCSGSTYLTIYDVPAFDSPMRGVRAYLQHS